MGTEPGSLAALHPKLVELNGLLGPQPAAASHAPNEVHTHRYTPLNFVPLQLFEQLNPVRKFANFYFLCVGVLQGVPAISVTGGVPVLLGPLLFVTGLDAAAKLYEDWQRRRADGLTNRQRTRALSAQTGGFEPARWDALRVGDIVQLSARETVPADLLLLGASDGSGEPSGHCWLSTKSLDGETDAKLREAPRATAARLAAAAAAGQTPASALLSLRGSLRCEGPNSISSDFSGLLRVEPPGAAGQSEEGGAGGGGSRGPASVAPAGAEGELCAVSEVRRRAGARGGQGRARALSPCASLPLPRLCRSTCCCVAACCAARPPRTGWW